jgi:hypothetical protein
VGQARREDRGLSVPSPRLTLPLVGLLALGLLGCADPLGWTREHTYPPDFNYIPREKLRSTMWSLAAEVTHLDRIMREAADSGRYPREEVLAVLARMEVTAGALGHEGWPSNHPRIGQNVGLLREDIQRARFQVERDPPNYFRAGALSGACTYCHGPRL